MTPLSIPSIDRFNNHRFRLSLYSGLVLLLPNQPTSVTAANTIEAVSGYVVFHTKGRRYYIEDILISARAAGSNVIAGCGSWCVQTRSPHRHNMVSLKATNVKTLVKLMAVSHIDRVKRARMHGYVSSPRFSEDTVLRTIGISNAVRYLRRGVLRLRKPYR